MPKKISVSPDWSSLPMDALLLILERLPVKDHLRAGAVCVSWNRAVATKLVSSAPPLPWLMVDPSRRGLSLTRAMFDPFSGKEECRVRLPSHKSILGSTSDGYIMYVDNNSDLLLVNPLTRSCIALPPLPKDEPIFIMKAALCHRPTIVVAIAYVSGTRGQLAFSRPGDESWTSLGQAPFINGMVFHKGFLYLVSPDRGTIIWDFSGAHPPRLMHTLKPNHAGFSFDVEHMFLVRSSDGSALLQTHSTRYGEHAIYLLEEDPAPNWRRVARLCGDDALMLSKGLALCVSAVDFPVLRGNCIYSTLYWEPPVMPKGMKRKHFLIGTELRVFNLGDGTMEFVPLPRKRRRQLNWFAPCL